MIRTVRSVTIAVSLLWAVAAAAAPPAQDAQTPYAATRLIWHWRGIMNDVLEESRAFAAEDVTDAMEVFVSPGAVRAVQDKLTEDQLKNADRVVERFALEVVAASTRRDDGSRIVEEAAVVAGRKAVCPVYPFCE